MFQRAYSSNTDTMYVMFVIQNLKFRLAAIFEIILYFVFVGIVINL